jgi:hypothetical protein
MTVAGKVSATRYNSRFSLSSGFRTSFTRVRVASFFHPSRTVNRKAQRPASGAARTYGVQSQSINRTGGGF